jgi:hypothetical protein
MKKPTVISATKRACESLKTTLTRSGYEISVTVEEGCKCVGLIRGNKIEYSKPLNALMELKTLLTLLNLQRCKKGDCALFSNRAHIEMNDEYVLFTLELLVSTTLNQMTDEYHTATEAA